MATVEQPLDMDTVLQTLTADVPQVAHVETQPARSARYQNLRSPLPAPLGAAVRANGIQRLYTHQAEAVERVRAGEHIAVVTATASGKSLCYQLPVLEALLNDPAGFCFYLSPTKALAHDQLRSLRRLLEHLPDIRAATYDGDTPRNDRDALRQKSHILLTNPDMLHRSILPAHTYGWQDALSKLRFLVIDEVHTLVGTFGTHVAFIIRRLLRLARHYGANPQIIAASATSANPKEHVEALTGQPVLLIENDGAPRGERHVVFWQPPLLDVISGPEGEKKRKSATSESAVVWTRLIGLGVKTLAFTSSRRGAELLQKLARTALERQHPEAAARIATYRAGYSPEDRKDLEQRFISGDLLGLASTNALELGIDIGSLDAVVLCGYPGRQAAAWQQIGRAGRSQSTSLAVLVATDDAIDQFYVLHPQRFFAAPIEQARVALDNSYVAAEQLVCAAFELPLTDEDTVFGPAYERLRAWLLRQKRLVQRGGDNTVSAERWPAREVSIRSIWSDSVELTNSATGRLIERIAAERAPFDIYPGAIYMVQDQSFRVVSLDLEQKQATARPVEPQSYTQAQEETTVSVREQRETYPTGSTTMCSGIVRVARQVVSYRERQLQTDDVVNEADLDLPAQEYFTQAVWFGAPQALAHRVGFTYDLAGSLNGLAEALLAVLPLLTQCDRRDAGYLAEEYHEATGGATIIIFDSIPGGIGIAQAAFERSTTWLEAARDLIAGCACTDGCPACVQSKAVGRGRSAATHKAGALLLVECLLEPLS